MYTSLSLKPHNASRIRERRDGIRLIRRSITRNEPATLVLVRHNGTELNIAPDWRAIERPAASGSLYRRAGKPTDLLGIPTRVILHLRLVKRDERRVERRSVFTDSPRARRGGRKVTASQHRRTHDADRSVASRDWTAVQRGPRRLVGWEGSQRRRQRTARLLPMAAPRTWRGGLAYVRHPRSRARH